MAPPFLSGQRPVQLGWRHGLEWLTACAIVLGAWFWSPAKVLSHVWYDFIASYSPAQSSSDIVVVAIDDVSIVNLGGWPINREAYTRLLKRLALPENRPAAIGFDLLFLDDKPEDPAFAQAMQALPVVLAQEPEREIRASTPVHRHSLLRSAVAPLQGASTAQGHIGLSYDSDGVLRSLPTEWSGVPHFSTALLRAGHSTAKPPLSDAPLRLRLISPEVQFPTLSLSEALNPAFSLNFLKNKWVLVGATSPTLGDLHATRETGYTQQVLPGVMVIASAIQASLTSSWIEPAPQALAIAIHLVALSCIFFLLLIYRPRFAIWISLGILALLSLCSAVLLWQWNCWFDVAPLLLSSALLMLYWAWSKLTGLMQFVERKTLLMGQHEPIALPHINDHRPAPRVRTQLDVVAAATHRMDAAIHNQQEQLMLLEQLLQQMPEAVAVFNEGDSLVMVNQRLRELLPEHLAMPGTALSTWLQWMKLNPQTFVHWASEIQDHPDQMLVLESRIGPRSVYIKTALLHNPHSPSLGLLTFVDVTELKRYQQERDQALQFLSHDLRSPVASILTLTDTRHGKDPIESTVLPRIERHAQQLLQWMDGFLMHRRAQSDLILTDHLLDDLINEAVAQAQELAEQQNITLVHEISDQALFVQADATLMVRALLNLIINAIRHGEPDSSVTLTTQVQAQDNKITRALVVIRNRTAPLPSEASRLSRAKGYGLGLAFVEQVAHKHGGSLIQDLPAQDVGLRSTGKVFYATMTLCLPCTIEAFD